MKGGAGRRRRGRELALRVLFELEGTERDVDQALRYQAEDIGAPADVEAFARELVVGTIRDLDRIDGAVSAASENWRLEEIGKVERAVLRMGAYELLRGEVPVAVAIDESIELARAYAGEEAARFVNGVLGRVAVERV